MMKYNKIIYGTTTLIDLTNDTVSTSTLMKGKTAHAANGDIITGTAEVTVENETLIMPIGFITVS